MLVKWKARNFRYKQKNKNWFWLIGAIFLLISFSAFYFFDDLVGAILIFTIGILILLATNKRPIIETYEINKKGFVLKNNTTHINFEEVKDYNIDIENRKIIVNTKKKLRSPILIPFEKVHGIDAIDDFLSKRIEKNEKLKIQPADFIFEKIMRI